jgi:phage terminase large subunit
MANLADLIQHQAAYVYESEKWLADILNFNCIGWQSDACKEYDKVGHSAWSTGTGVGKTALLARLALHFLMTRSFPVIPIIAPTQKQLHNALWAEIIRAIRQSPILQSALDWTQDRVFLKGYKENWFATAITARPPKTSDVNTVESVQGIHTENVLVLVDEASGVPDQVMGAIDGLISTPSARSILASNPTRNTGYFYKVVTSPDLHGLWAVRFVDAERIDAPFIDKSYIERLKVIYGAESDYFRMRVKGLPPRTEFNALISPEQIYEAHKRILPRTGHKFLSTDVARFGADDSVYYLRDGNVIVERIAINGMDVTQVGDIGLQFFSVHDIEEWRIDSVGIGAGVVDYARRELGSKRSRVRAVHVGEDANNKEEFFNKRAEIMWNLRTSIDSLSIPIETPLLDEELVQIRYGWDNRDKRIKLESKDTTKSALGRSPDDADSLGINCANLKTPNAIASVDFFKVGATNPLGLSPEKLIQELHTNKKAVRPNISLRTFAERNNDIGINRFRQFKEDHSNFYVS